MKKMAVIIIMFLITFYSYSISDIEYRDLVIETSNRLEKFTDLLKKIKIDTDVDLYFEEVKKMAEEFKLFINKYKSIEQELKKKFNALNRNDPLYIRATKISEIFIVEYLRIGKLPKGVIIMKIINSINSREQTPERNNSGNQP